MPTGRVFANCLVHTLDPLNTKAEAIAVEGERIAAVGDLQDMRRLAGPDSEEIDLEGCAVVPGLTDAHTHLVHYGVSASRSADLSGSDSIEEVLRRLRLFRERNPHLPWLLGRGFDHELFEEGRWVTRADLDRVSAKVPVMITRLCLHALVANSAALKAVEGRLTAEQSRTGILTEDATGLVWEQVPEPTPSELEDAIVWALQDARRVGLSCVHSQISGDEDLRALRALRDRGALPVRVRAQCPVSMMPRLSADGMTTGWGDDRLRIGSMKLYADGAMGARTAAMKEPFTDDPGNSGMLLMTEADMVEALHEVQANRCQAAFHAIGDRALECVLNAIEMAAPEANPDNVLRHRVEHASQTSASVVETMARLNVPAVVQPQFVITDFWTPERVGPKRYPWSYAFRSMLDAGVTLAMGSDCPVERLDPIELISRAVNREPRSLAERLTVEQALRAYAHGGAYVGFADDRAGSIEPGKLADFAALYPDPFEIEQSRLGEVQVRYNVIGGSL